MNKVQLSVAVICIAASASTSAEEAARSNDGIKERASSASAAPLREASGKLKHVFSIPFRASPAVLSEIKGLESLTVARLSSGRTIEVMLDYGVPYPTRALSVDVGTYAVKDTSLGDDPLAPPPTMPVRSGHQLISTFKFFGSDSYICVWQNLHSDESSLTSWRGSKSDKHILLATSHRAILAAGVQPTMHGRPDMSIVVWTRGPFDGDVVAGLYSWNAYGR